MLRLSYDKVNTTESWRNVSFCFILKRHMFVLIDNKEDLKANININRLKTEEISQTMKKNFFCIY